MGVVLFALAALGTALVFWPRKDGASALRRLRARYGRGCVVTVSQEGRANVLECRMPGYSVGHAGLFGGIFRMEAVGTRAGRPRWARLAVDFYSMDGRFLGRKPRTDLNPPLMPLGKIGVWAWPLPDGVRVPFFAAVSAAR